MDIDLSLVEVPTIERNNVLYSLILKAVRNISPAYIIKTLDLDVDSTAASRTLAPAGKPVEHLMLSDKQVQYLSARASGRSVIDSLRDSGVTALEIVLWTDNTLFRACNEILKEAETVQAEAMAWHVAGSDPSAMAERAFTIKSRRSEYRDNQPAVPRDQINIHVTIGKDPYEIKILPGQEEAQE